MSERLIINVAEIEADGLDVRGELPGEVLDLHEDRLSSLRPLQYTLLAQRTGEDVLVAGQAATVVRCRCDRCLVYYDQDLRCPEVCHFFEAPVADTLDLTDLVREDLLLLLAQKNLCQPECRGLCPRCGQNLNVRDCHCEREQRDAGVWDQLNGLKL